MDPCNREMLLFYKQIICGPEKGHKAQLSISGAGVNNYCGGKGV